jgi:hypothetical protein
MPVDGLQRLLLYQPHHLTGYVFALCALRLPPTPTRSTKQPSRCGAASCWGWRFSSARLRPLSSVLPSESFATRLAAARAFTRMLAERHSRTELAWLRSPSAVLWATPTRPGFTNRFQSETRCAAPWAFKLRAAAVRRHCWPPPDRGVIRDGAAPAALVLVSLAFYFLADVPDLDGVWVGWRSGHLLLIASAVIGAALMTAVWTNRLLR